MAPKRKAVSKGKEAPVKEAATVEEPVEEPVEEHHAPEPVPEEPHAQAPVSEPVIDEPPTKKKKGNKKPEANKAGITPKSDLGEFPPDCASPFLCA